MLDAWPTKRRRRPPNTVFILADDLGYGDIGAFNPDSKIPTPALDRLATEGIRLTDVHSATFCCPSRYQFLTGQYKFRTSAQGLESYLAPGQPTVASLLAEAGYRTAMLGKWHVGFAGLGLHPDPPEGTETLPGGPVDFGFDSYFGIPASLDISPYFFIEDDRVVDFPSESIDENHSAGVRWPQGRFWRGGGLAPGYRHERVLPELTDRAVRFIEQQGAGDGAPFFLYFALPAPHAPWVPTEEFQGRSGAGEYGDFVMQVDDVVRRVLDALDAAGASENTLIVFTSDNGPTWYEEDVERYGHRSAGDWRGMKRDAWEGGNRMPFIARWPGHIDPGSSSSAIVSFTDMLATFVGAAGGRVPESAAIDSLDVLPVLTGQDTAVREQVVIEGDHELAIRRGDWKLLPWLSERSTFDVVFPPGGGQAPPEELGVPVPGGPHGQLYNLVADPAERHNVYLEHPDIVAELSALLDEVRVGAANSGRTRGPRTTDDGVML
jgi:arylsulfatase A